MSRSDSVRSWPGRHGPRKSGHSPDHAGCFICLHEDAASRFVDPLTSPKSITAHAGQDHGQRRPPA